MYIYIIYLSHGGGVAKGCVAYRRRFAGGQHLMKRRARFKGALCA